ncbi:FkbM family methyltransferase [Caldisphaera lagunensis]|uniref:FkbM family methyltransferase n=1 Tax=Caldisphaera lagunensis TaxID=200415 RepID=UPI000662A2FB|nr:FkbM family methyltransferase [Caldisphaera lagunensis]
MILLLTPNGLKFYIENFDPLIFSETFIYDIHYSDNLNGKIVIQAGGFTGDTALYYASKGARVYSFEPDPINYELALKNISLNPHLAQNIIMKNYALGKDEIIDFPITGTGFSSAYNLNTGKTTKVRSISITQIIKEFNITDPYLLDLDIKGKEFEVINDESLSLFRKVRIEYSPDLVGLKDYGFKSIRVFKHNCLNYDLHYHGTIEATK